MMIKRKNIDKINQLFNRLSNERFDIKLQYKLIKIKKAIQEEADIYQEQLFKNCSPFFELDENGQPIVNSDGGFKIQEQYIVKCNNILRDLNKLDVQIPDIYFSIDELEPLNLTFGELEILMPFIQ